MGSIFACAFVKQIHFKQNFNSLHVDARVPSSSSSWSSFLDSGDKASFVGFVRREETQRVGEHADGFGVVR